MRYSIDISEGYPEQGDVECPICNKKIEGMDNCTKILEFDEDEQMGGPFYTCSERCANMWIFKHL